MSIATIQASVASAMSSSSMWKAAESSNCVSISVVATMCGTSPGTATIVSFSASHRRVARKSAIE